MKEKGVFKTIRPLLLIVLALALVAGVACGEDDKDKSANNDQPDAGSEIDVEEEQAEIALVGIWGTIDNNVETITATKWDKMTIIEYDNDERWVITQNPPDDLSANKYNKILWTPIVRQEFYYCMIEIGRNELDQIKNSTLEADDSEPTQGGCPKGTIQTWSLLKKL